MFASCLATLTRATLVSPAAMEEFISGISHFGTFRSKEVWLDAFAIMVRNATRFGLNGEEVSRIEQEYVCFIFFLGGQECMAIGEPGPGPRRLIRFIAGAPVPPLALKIFQKNIPGG